jgi:protein involved in polysaccharide export with SLBB domain
VSLYDFLLKGSLPTIQFADGDTIHVGQLTNTVSIEGEVNNAARFEFREATIPAATVVGWSTPRADVTHIRVRRNNSGETTAEYLPLIALGAITLMPGDRVTLIPEDRPQQIVVGINGEHDGAKEYVVTPGTRLGAVFDQIVPSDRTRFEAIQLFRVSVKERQTALLQRSLDQLEREVLAARSATDEEASIRLREAELIQSFIARARKLEPQGLVVLGGPEDARDLYLEDGDILFLPAKSRLITIAGEVMFPTAVTWRSGASIKDYIEIAGGYTRTADTKRVLIRRANGEITSVSVGGFSQPKPGPGDEIMVLPEPNVKNLQLAKSLAQILFQLAVTTSVILDL